MSLEISHDLLNATDHTESVQPEWCSCRLAVDTGASKAHLQLVFTSVLGAVFRSNIFICGAMLGAA